MLLILFCIGAEIQQSTAQQMNIDSLFAVLKTEEADTNRVKILNYLSDEYVDYDPVKAMKYAKEGLELSKKIGFNKGLVYSLNSLGVAYINSGNFDSALICFEKKFQVVIEMKDSVGIAITLGNMVIIYTHFGENERALNMRIRANDIFNALNDSLSLSTGYSWIGNIYLRQGDYQKALEYYFKAKRISEKLHEQINIGIENLNISSVYRKLNEFNIAKKYANEAKTIFIDHDIPENIGASLYRLSLIFSEEKNYDSSNYYLKEAKKEFEKIKNGYWLSYVNQQLGNNFLQMGYFDKAIQYFTNALDSALIIGDKDLISTLYGSIGFVYEEKKEYLKALNYLERSFLIFNKTNNRESLKSITESFIKVYSQINKPDSVIKYFHLYQQLSDTLFNQQKISSIAEMQTKYETEKKDNQIALLNLENNLKDQQTKQVKMERDLSIIGIFLIIIVGFSIFFLWRKRREIINEKRVNEIKSKVERIKISPHFLKNTLSFIDDFYVRNNDIGNASKYLNKLQQLMICILEDSDHELISLEKEIETLKLYINLLNLGSRNLVDWTIECEPDIDTEQILVPPTIIQPLVENSFKHAFKGVNNPKLEVKFAIKDEMLSCLVIDNGTGWEGPNKNTKNQKDGLGIPVTVGRIDIYGKQKNRKGQLIIEELKDVFQKCVGTKIEIVLPVSFAF